MPTPPASRTWRTTIASAFLCVLSAGSTLAADAPTSNAGFLSAARAKYYSLQQHGMTSFQCSVAVDWATVLSKAVPDITPEQLSAVEARLNQLHFDVTVPVAGDATITHNEIAAENEQVSEGLKQIYSGMEQALTGFFRTWSTFAVQPPLPEVGTEIELEASGSDSRITYKEGDTDVAVIVDANSKVKSVRAVAKEFTSSIYPKFDATSQGLLMSGYDAVYEGANGNDRTNLHVVLENQTTDGLQIPHALNLSGSYNDSPFAMTVTFADCHARAATPGQ